MFRACPSSPGDLLSAAEHRRLFALPGIGMLSLDSDGRIVDVNAFLSGALLHTCAELKGTFLRDISGLSSVAAASQAVERLQRSGHLRHADLPLLSKDGARVHFGFRRLGVLASGAVLLECRSREPGIGDARRDPRDAAIKRPQLVIVDAKIFEVAANRELARTRDHGAPLSLLSIRIDRAVAAGASDPATSPLLLRGLAAACAEELRATDLVGKVGASAFVVLLPDTSASGARSTAERLRTAVAAMQWPAGRRRVTLSIGTVTTRTGKSAYRALRSRADAKREDARGSGGNRVNT
jgi:diguanylate cyclase (GGDEF)-like protein